MHARHAESLVTRDRTRKLALMSVRRAALGSVCWVLWIIAGAGCSSTTFEPRQINFAQDTPGGPPRHFTVELSGGGPPAVWNVRQDASIGPVRQAVVQESRNHTSYRFPLCIYSDAYAADVSVQTLWQAIGGDVDQAGGVVARYRPDNYYFARADALEDNIALFRMVHGKREKIDEVSASVAPRRWHRLRLDVKGTHLQVFYDGRLVIDRNDRAISGAGYTGLATEADSVSAFTEFKVKPLADGDR